MAVNHAQLLSQRKKRALAAAILLLYIAGTDAGPKSLDCYTTRIAGFSMEPVVSNVYTHMDLTGCTDIPHSTDLPRDTVTAGLVATAHGGKGAILSN